MSSIESGSRKFLHGDNFHKFWENYYEHHEWLEDEKINLYIDFPYCVSTCKYCMIQPANINEHRSEIPVYERELVKLIASFSDIFPRHQIGQIAFGGGTASLLSRDTVREIVKAVGPSWDKAYARKMEVHPHNLSEDYIKFLIDECHITNLSMGIQTFNTESLRQQNRIAVNLNTLIKHVQQLHDGKVSVNMDLVALFNGDTERDWEIFRDDMKIVKEFFNPDMFFTQVNFATQERYYEYTLRMRRELCEFIETAPEYMFADERYRKLDIDDVQAYLDTTYFMVKPYYMEYLLKYGLYKTDPRYGNYIGFGGNISHRVFSLTSEKDTIYSHYDFYKNRWIHELMPTVVPKVVDGVIPTISCGRYIIPPYNPAISGEIKKEG